MRMQRHAHTGVACVEWWAVSEQRGWRSHGKPQRQPCRAYSRRVHDCNSKGNRCKHRNHKWGRPWNVATSVENSLPKRRSAVA